MTAISFLLQTKYSQLRNILGSVTIKSTDIKSERRLCNKSYCCYKSVNYLLLVLLVAANETDMITWICENDGIENTELNDINVDATQPLNKLQ